MRLPSEQMLPVLAASSDWESLLDHGLVDAVLVGRGTVTDDLKAEQLKRFVADAVPTLIVHPATLSVLPFYELDMGRRESHAVVRHFNPLVGNPAVSEMASWLKTGESEIGVDPPSRLPTISRPIATAMQCLRHLARDVELLRSVAGEVRSVGAVGPRVADATYASLQVQLSGTASTTFRWSVVPSPGTSSRVELTLIGERGTATLRLPPDPAPQECGHSRCTLAARNQHRCRIDSRDRFRTGMRRTLQSTRSPPLSRLMARRQRFRLHMAKRDRFDGNRRRD